MTLQIFSMTDSFSVVVSYITKVCGWSQTEHQLLKAINMINITRRATRRFHEDCLPSFPAPKRAISSSYYCLHPIHGLGGERLDKAGLPSFSLQFVFFLLRHSNLTEEFDSRNYHRHPIQGLGDE